MRVNKRARARLIGVTVIIVVAVAAIIMGAGSGDGAYARSVSEALEDPALIGERVKVSGTVVDGSWDQGVKPMLFDIRDQEEAAGPVIAVIYDGSPPDTFGDGATAIVTGILLEGGTIEASSMITQCPSKYESATGALGVSDVLASGQSIVNVEIDLTGVVASDIQPAGGTSRFAIGDSPEGDKIGIAFDKALPAGISKGVAVVLKGEMGDDGLFYATSVALSDTEQ